MKTISMSQQQRVCFIIPLNISSIHDICRLFSHLLMYFGSLYCKQSGPRSDCSPRSSLIRVHSVCFNRISLDLIATYATGVIRRGHYLYKMLAGKWLMVFKQSIGMTQNRIVFAWNAKKSYSIGCASRHAGRAIILSLAYVDNLSLNTHKIFKHYY